MVIACKQRLGLFAFLVLLMAKAAAQPNCKVEYYSTENGLSHQAVTCILKDREGFMWFGTWDGINRFDGHSFLSYKSLPGDQSQLGNGRVDQIVEDQGDHLWIEAYDRQIYRFDKKNGQFMPLSPVINPEGKQKVSFSRIVSASNGWVWLQSVNEGLFCVAQNDLSPQHIHRYKKGLPGEYALPSNTISFFHEDQQKMIWIGTEAGLSCLVPSKSGIYINNKEASVTIAAGKDFTAFDEDAGHLYFGTADGHLFTFEKTTRSFTVQKIATGRLNALLRSKKSDCIYAITNTGELISYQLAGGKIKTVSYRPGEPLVNLYEDRKGCLWIAPEKEGVLRFEPAAMSFTYYFHNNTDRLNMPRNPFSVFEDNNGVTWVYMKGGGFGYYDETTRSFNYFLHTPDAGNVTLPATSYRILYDSSGVFWLSTNERKLIKIILQSNVFEQQLLVEQPLSKFDNEVRGICYDNKNRLWLGAKNGKVYLYQHGKKLTGIFDNEPAEGPGLVYVIFQDSRDNIWLGTKGNGLYKAVPLNKEGTKYHLVHYLFNKANSNSLPCNDIYALLEDRQGRIWIGSFDKGLFLIQGVADSIQFVQRGDAFKNYPREIYNKIRHLALDSAGNIWIASTNGLLLLDADDRHSREYRYTAYRKIPGDGQSLGNNDIQFIYRDSKNRMWLATSGGGFCSAAGSEPFTSLKFKNYTTRDGMPNDYVLSCAQDTQGNLWIATENGLSRFNPENENFRNYDSYYGLAHVSFSEAAVCHSMQHDRLFYGSNSGYITFEPGLIDNNNRIAVNIAFTGLRINNEPVQPGLNTLLKEDINYLSQLTLQHDENIISIDYAILDNRAGKRHALVYRLLGFDSVWHDDGRQRRATYTNLPPGQYVFEVKSGTADLYFNNPYRRLTITILPPPWKTWWAYLLYALLLAVLLFFIRRTALAMIRLRNKIAVEQKLAALKVNFFTNVSHELRTPLTLIVNPIEQLVKKEKLSAEGIAYVEIAKKNAGRMMRFINQLLDLRKIESNKATLHVSRLEIVPFVTKIGEHFRVELESRDIRLNIMAEQQELFAWADAEKLDVVIYNLLANAVKFTPEGKTIDIIIRSHRDEPYFSIEVRDQGPGVHSEKLKEIFELFYEGDQPALNAQKGSGIGLALCRELVNLHGGSIYAENIDEGGLSVTVKLKLGHDHFSKEEMGAMDAWQSSLVHEQIPEQLTLQEPLPDAVPVNEEAPLLLLVEDNDDLRAFLKRQLSERYRVEVAGNGAAGWQKALQLLPDVIVSDIMMPVMDGIQMLDKIKNDINTSHIPVVLLSARHSVESQIEGLQYGADYYITKPFNTEFLVASIDNLLKQREKLFHTLVNKKPATGLSAAPVVVTTGDENFLKELISIVEEKMTDPGFNMETVAAGMKMSKSAFYKKFKSLTGIMPVEFVRDMRLQRARQYLDAGNNNIGEVAYLSGFSSPKYFSTCFREKYEVTPSEYLKARL